MVPRALVRTLLAGAVVLPVPTVLVFVVAMLLSGMQDAAAAKAVTWIAAGLFILWITNLVVLLIALTADSALRPDDEPPGEE